MLGEGCHKATGCRALEAPEASAGPLVGDPISGLDICGDRGL